MTHSPVGAAFPTANTPLPRRTPTSRASWTEYQRLLNAGVGTAAATILATGTPAPTTDETAYWRQIGRGEPVAAEARAAHALAQRRRRMQKNDPTAGRPDPGATSKQRYVHITPECP